MKILSIILVSLSITLNIKAQKVGDFSLHSVTKNSKFTLSEAQGKYVALHFLLKTECPLCIRHTHEYIENMEKLPNVIQVFAKPDTEEEIKDWASNLSEEELDKLPIFRDPNAELAKKMEIPHGYNFHKQVMHYPALVLIDKSGNEVFRYVGKNNKDRYSFEKLQSKIEELSK
jgi:peroxiredoxin Q/BCP